VGMVQTGSGPRFLFEPLHAIRVGPHGGVQHLYDDITIEPGVPREIGLAHAAGAEAGTNFVTTELRAGLEHRAEYAYSARLNQIKTGQAKMKGVGGLGFSLHAIPLQERSADAAPAPFP